MNDLNDLFYFAAVVRNKGFTAASRATGIEKTRFTRRIAALEKRLGVKLLNRSTRAITLTEAGDVFYEHCQDVIDLAEAAYTSIEEVQSEPTGKVRISCPVILAQNYLAPLLPQYMNEYPKVTVVLDATDRIVDPIEDRYDVILRARPQIEDSIHLVSYELGRARRILVASPCFIKREGRPKTISDLLGLATIARSMDIQGDLAQWRIYHKAILEEQTLRLKPALVCGDLRVQYEAAKQGIGLALMPDPIVAKALALKTLEHVLPEWLASEHIIHMLYARPRGLLPSVSSLIHYLKKHLPQTILERSI